MKNLISDTDDQKKAFSDLIKDFSNCQNSFISSERDHSKKKDKKPKQNSKIKSDVLEEMMFNTEYSHNGNSLDVKLFQNNNNSEYLESQFEKLKNIENNRTIRLLKDPILREKIEKKTMEQFLNSNRVILSDDFAEYKPRVEKYNKRINIVQGFLTFYSIYFMINIYESKKSIFDTTADLINKTPRKLGKLNLKLHLLIFTSLFTTLFFLIRKSSAIDNEFKKKIKDKYFEKGFDFSNVKIYS